MLKSGMEIPGGRLIRYFHTWLLCMDRYDIPGHVVQSGYEAGILATKIEWKYLTNLPPGIFIPNFSFNHKSGFGSRP